jgi:D-3-phosphoglycerate dehydrogenase
MKILVTPTSFGRDSKSSAKAELEKFATELVYNPFGRPLTAEELTPMLDGVDGVVAGLDFFTEAVISVAPPSLKVISRYGAGYDRVDVKAATQKGIAVANTPGVNSESVADLALALMLSLARAIPTLDAQVKAGGWPRMTGVEMYRKTIGILGLGAIGKAVARRAEGFSMHVIAYDPFMDNAYAEAHGIEVCDFENVIARADFLSLHLPMNDSTHNCIDEDAIANMKSGAILINTSRGGLMDEEAAYEALASGKLGGLGLDAFAVEPPGNSKLFTLQNVVVTPHIGANTKEATAAMGILAVQNLIDVLTGKPCRYVVNSIYA